MNAGYVCAGGYVNEIRLSLKGAGGGLVGVPANAPETNNCGTSFIYVPPIGGSVPTGTASVPVPTATPGSVDLTPTRGQLPWSDWNFITTTDIHGYINGQGGNNQGQYSANFADFSVFVDKMKAKADAQNVELFVVDCGDQHDGTALSDNLDVQPVDGYLTNPAIQLLPYDVLAIGNHELYLNPIIDDVTNNIAKFWGEKYLTGNVYTSVDKTMNANSVPIGNRFRRFTGSKGTKVTAFGWLFSSFANSQGTHAYITNVADEVKQQWFIDAVNQDADLFIITGHVTLRASQGSSTNSPEWDATIKAIRAIKPETPIVIFGGHLHIRDYKNMGYKAYGLSAGRYMETVGFMSLTKDGNKIDRRYLDANVPTYNYHIGQPANASLGSTTTTGQQILSIIAKASTLTKSNQVIGYVPRDYYLNRVSPTDDGSIYKLIGDYLAPTMQLPGRNPALFALNSGSIRLDLFKGPLTVDNAFQASPFSDYFMLIPNVPYSIIKQFATSLETYHTTHKFFTPARRQSCIGTMGYVTTDDLSSTNLGDDTFHCPYGFFSNSKWATYSPRIVPNGNPTDLWDLVVYDYIEKDVKAMLKDSFNFDTVPVGQSPNYYTNGNTTGTLKASDIFPMIAAKYWQTATSTSTATLTATATVGTYAYLIENIVSN
ncbi:Metallo-dependent phosphatase [Rhizoclosmatium globosum]|uniref:Metallo-dependent phosphatase n=1 Tax=Rhizoclosmatium globosum TaxID=329046 RepID=A0A1Y2C113_9FUNG|nr:Metallo-dependent phosphatase [Rhizoclosmatium globosum]|eukprot:ORY40656.1 Metallo-dependent phosphatase [Rhizoclosmatium globosum]